MPLLSPISFPGRFMVALEIIGDLLVAHTVGTRHHRLSKHDSPFSSLEESHSLLLVLRTYALAYRPSVRVVLNPEDRSVRPIPPSWARLVPSAIGSNPSGTRNTNWVAYYTLPSRMATTMPSKLLGR